METSRFEDIREAFFERLQRAVYCNVATVDRRGRPRSRVMHLVWDGPVGWGISWPQSHKSRHLATNPAVSIAYIADPLKPVYIDGTAEWVDDEAEQRRVWDLHRQIPPPLGFDPEPHYGTIANPLFGLLRITPWRIELGALGGEPVVWRPEAAG